MKIIYKDVLGIVAIDNQKYLLTVFNLSLQKNPLQIGIFLVDLYLSNIKSDQKWTLKTS